MSAHAYGCLKDDFKPAMEPGTLYCERCDATCFPAYDWQGEGHVAVRLWDARPELATCCQALRDGAVVERVKEMMAGRDGWVIFEPQPEQFCPVCTGYLLTITFGEVTAIPCRW